MLSMLFMAAFCAGQSSPQTPDAGQSAQPPASQTAQTDPAQKPSQNKKDDQGKDKSGQEAVTSGTSKDRLFFALPNFLTVDANGKIIPLTAGQKFKVVARGTFDPVQIVWYAGALGH